MSSEPEFPTGSTVPFPYSPPYAVQTELMSAILTSLRQCHERDTATSIAKDDAAEGISTKDKKRRAPIIMVESPTGTGKSLSLACASMAWLRYCEEIDLKEIDVIKDAKEESSSGASVVADSSITKRRRDWLDSWQPETLIPTAIHSLSNNSNNFKQSQTSQTQVRKYAISNRALLNKELNTIRARLAKLSNVAAISESTKKSHNMNPERVLRENLLKSGISRALAAERKRNRGEKGKSTGVKKRRIDEEQNEIDFMLDDYHSDDNAKMTLLDGSDSEDDDVLSSLNNKPLSSDVNGSNISTKAMLYGVNLDGSGCNQDPELNARVRRHGAPSNLLSTVGEVTPGSGYRKIIYAARTHSQLSQFIGELKRTHWGDSVKVVTLGSRSVLCSNDDVLYSSSRDKARSRRSEAEVTEICLDMQKSKSGSGKDSEKGRVKVSSKCPLLESSDAVSTLAMHSLVQPSDIEDVVGLGKVSRVCSYYASREAIPAAEVVVLPYNSLLSEQARQSIGLSLKNALIVIDEAHNVPEALRGISSCQLSFPIIEAAVSQLTAYTTKYSGRLAGRNLTYLGQIRRVLMAMSKFLKRPPLGSDDNTGEKNNRKEMLPAVDLMFRLKLDNLNLFTLLRYIQKSRISQKLLGFANHAGLNNGTQETEDSEKAEQKAFMSKHVSALSIVETFLEKLTSTSREGKVIVEWPSDNALHRSGSCHALFRFVQIHSASLLDTMVEEAHAIILAGGTLRPFSHVAAELFAHNDDVMKAATNAELETSQQYDNAPLRPSSSLQVTSQLTTFTCGHVIPSKNVIMSYLSSGPTSHKLDFRHTSRSSNDMIDELGRTLVNLCNVVPFGFVVFLPSYNYESLIFQRWRSTGMLAQINKKKPIHREPKSSRDLDTALARYSTEASSSKTGALLFSVMGGKMSEGINFANDMARAVFVVGLPYPDMTDPILLEKMQSLDREYTRTGTGITGQSYYRSLCMRAVNQSIGRAIRHANDYASIILADYRYTSDSKIWRGLPAWLRSEVPDQSSSTFDRVFKDVRSFFSDK